MSDEYDGETDDAPEPRKVFWQGRQWCVTDYGIETIKRDRYYIEAERLGDLTDGRDRDVRPGAERMRHTGGKTWVDIEGLSRRVCRCPPGPRREVSRAARRGLP